MVKFMTEVVQVSKCTCIVYQISKDFNCFYDIVK